MLIMLSSGASAVNYCMCRRDWFFLHYYFDSRSPFHVWEAACCGWVCDGSVLVMVSQ